MRSVDRSRGNRWAAELSADPAFRPDLGDAWAVAKIYYCVVPYSFLQAGIDALAAAGQSEIFGNATRAEEIGFGVPDDQVSAIIQADDYDAALAIARECPPGHTIEIREFAGYA